MRTLQPKVSSLLRISSDSHLPQAQANMIRTALRQPINNIVSGSRGLASSSQFRKVWEKETVNSLKQELGLRGLSRYVQSFSQYLLCTHSKLTSHSPSC
jgi:hypothetical protein